MTDTCRKIVEAADRLFYERGFEHTSFADIAEAVKISRGNFYYHFKTKDEILSAVIAYRLEDSQAMIAAWERETDDPAGRIRLFIRIILDHGDDIVAYGCPLGTLNAELAKLSHTAKEEAAALFTLFRDWLRTQFADLGCGDEADAHAMRVLAWSQGVATMLNALRDVEFAEAEVTRMTAWLEATQQQIQT